LGPIGNTPTQKLIVVDEDDSSRVVSAILKPFEAIEKNVEGIHCTGNANDAAHGSPAYRATSHNSAEAWPLANYASEPLSHCPSELELVSFYEYANHRLGTRSSNEETTLVAQLSLSGANRLNNSRILEAIL